MFNLNLNLSENKENDALSLNTFKSFNNYEYMSNLVNREFNLNNINTFQEEEANFVKVKKVGRKKKTKKTYGIDQSEIVDFLNRKTNSPNNYFTPDFKRKSLIFNQEEYSYKHLNNEHLDGNNLLRISKVNNFVIQNFPKMTIHYKNSKIKIAVEYFNFNQNLLQQFPNLKIKNFGSFEQNQNLINFFNNTSDIISNHLTTSFSITNFFSSTDQIYNLISNLKIEKNFAILSDKLDEKNSLILFNTNKFIFSDFLLGEFTIFSISDELLRPNFKIQKLIDISILSGNLNLLYEDHPVTNFGSKFLDLTFTLDSQFSQLINLNNENRSLKQENLRSLENVDRLNKWREKFINLIKININENKENICISDDQFKLKYIEEKFKCQVEILDGFLIESKFDESNEDEENVDNVNSDCIYSDQNNLVKNLNSFCKQQEQLTCLICLDKIRNVLFSNCGHVSYCFECCEKISNQNSAADAILNNNKIKKRGRKLNSSNLTSSKLPENVNLIENFNVKCPSCESISKKYSKLIFS